MALADFEIGSTYVGMENVEDLLDDEPLEEQMPPPRATPVTTSNPVELATGHVRGAGWLTCTWTWDLLTQKQYDELRAFCTGKSDDVFINTKLEDGTYDEYTAILVWPEGLVRSFGVYTNVVLEFRALEVYTP